MFARISTYEPAIAQAVPGIHSLAVPSASTWVTPDFYALFSVLADDVPSSGNRREAAQQFGLAVHRQVRHWCIEERARFVVAATPGRIELHDGYHVVRRTDGTLATNLLGHIDHVTISDLPKVIYRTVTNAVLKNLMARLVNLFEVQAQQAGQSDAWVKRHLGPFESWVIWAYSTFKPAVWGRRTKEVVLSKYLAKLMWEHGVLDRAVFRAGIRIHGFNHLLVRQYNAVCGCLSLVEARLAEAPNLAPLMLPEVVTEHGPDTLRALREIFLANDGTPAGWRWITRQGWTFIRRQVGPLLTKSANNRMLSAFAEAQVGRLPGGAQMALNLALFWTALGGQVRELERKRYVAMMRLFSREYQSRKTKVCDLLNQLPLVQDFVTHMGPSENLHKATWSSLVKRQEEWHRKEARERREQEKERCGAYRWASLTEAQMGSGVQAISLDTSDDLWEEGEEMGHCVGGYANACFTNRSRIYSIRTLTGVRKATLEITQNHQGRWHIRQLYGPRNQVIKDKAVEALARQVVRAANKAKPLNRQDNSVLRQPKQMARSVFARPALQMPAIEDERLDLLEEIPF